MQMTTEQQTPTRPHGVVELIAKLLVVGAPIAYALGRAYSEGYWRTIGITPTVMARGFEDYAYFFFVMVVELAIIPIRWAGAGSFLFAIAAVLAVFVAVALLTWAGEQLGQWVRWETRSARRKLRVWLRHRKSMRVPVGTGADAATLLAIAAIGGIYLLIVLILCVSVAQWVGTQQATRAIERMKDGDDRFEAVVVTIDGADHKARMLECNDRRCVIYVDSIFIATPESSVRWPLPQSTEDPEGNGGSEKN